MLASRSCAQAPFVSQKSAARLRSRTVITCHLQSPEASNPRQLLTGLAAMFFSVQSFAAQASPIKSGLQVSVDNLTSCCFVEVHYSSSCALTIQLTIRHLISFAPFYRMFSADVDQCNKAYIKVQHFGQFRYPPSSLILQALVPTQEATGISAADTFLVKALWR